MAEAARQTEETISNQPVADDDAIAVVNLGRIVEADRELNAAKEDHKETVELAVSNGINLNAAKKAFKIITAGEATAWLQETRDITRYLRILRHGIQESQLALEFETTLAPIDEKAGADGRMHGLMGNPERYNPHDLSTVAGQAWLAAHRQGYAERVLILSMKDEAPETDESEEDGED